MYLCSHISSGDVCNVLIIGVSTILGITTIHPSSSKSIFTCPDSSIKENGNNNATRRMLEVML